MMVLQNRALEHRPNPMSEANFFSRYFLIWFWPIFKKGYRDQLTINDLWDPVEEDKAGVNADKLEGAWNRNTKSQSENNARLEQNHEQVQFLPSNNESSQSDTKNCKVLYRAMREAFTSEYLLAGPMLLLTDCGLKVVQPWFMLLLVRTFIVEPRDEIGQYLYAAGVCISTFLITLTSNPCLFYLGRVCQRCRIALASMIQRKVLRLSATTKGTNQGQIATLISNDTSTIENNLMLVPYIVVAPLQLALFLWFLVVEFGWSSMAGVGFILVYMPFQYLNNSLSTKYRGKIGERTDERTRLLSEVVDAIQSVKMYAWEFIFQKLLQERRKKEVSQLRKRSRLHAFQMSVFFTSSRVVPFLTFTAFVLARGPLTADRVFYAVAAYNMMTHYMVFMFPNAIRGLGEIEGSLVRIQTFLELPEKPSNQGVYLSTGSTGTLSLSSVSATWNPTDTIPVLRDVTIEMNPQIKTNPLIIVVGKVGSGKTSLLHLILNELYIKTGGLSVPGSLSYAPQESPLFPDSIRANILNNSVLNQKRYNAVLEAACLKDDIDAFDDNDSRKVVALSGGQKARTNLARAIYKEADVYLLDDPLSSIDPAVSRNIFENAIMGFLKDKMRILVTHQLQYLNEADHIIVMQRGTIRCQGTLDQVQEAVNEELGCSTDASVDALMARGAVNASAKAKDANANETCVDMNDKEDEEEQGVGALGLKIYLKYFNAGKSKFQLLTYLSIFIISQIFTTLIEYWLALWTNAEEKMYKESLAEHRHNSYNSTTYTPVWTVDRPDTDSDAVLANDTFTWQGFEHFLENLDNLKQNMYLYIYLILTAIVFLTNLAKAFAFFQYCMRISTNLHEKMLRCLVRAKPVFFDKNPSGRILNRFTRDVSVIDTDLPFSFFDMWTIYLQVGTVIILVIFANWYTVFPIFIFLLMLGYVRGYYVATSRDLKRIDGTTRSPIISNVQATYATLVTMRALGVEAHLTTQFDGLQDANMSATISFLAACQCFNIWIELLATVLLTIVTYGFLFAQNFMGIEFPSGNVGLAICSAMSLTIWLNYGMKVSANVENLMISVERAIEYTKLDSEAALESNSANKPPDSWPEKGQINFQNVTLSYDGETNILKQLSFDVGSGEKIGIVGQTGAGKSSVLVALFRMTEPADGTIAIDSKDTANLGLHTLRSGMVIIPQEPKLFKGTLEFNLDPRSSPEINDQGRVPLEKMKEIIGQIGLHKDIKKFKLESKGGGLSSGEKQLVSIARALLLNRRIVCLDEATAQIDQGTDQKIQDILRNRDTLKQSTTITIAHRLGTVIESDKILVLDNGQRVEYDHPHLLLQNPKGWLTKMVNKTGAENAADLKRRAYESWQKQTQNREAN